MSSSGIQPITSGPLIIRTYNASSSSDVTYVLQDYDYPVSSNYVLITSTNGQLVPSNNIYVSSITTSSFNSDFGRFSTLYQSSVFGFSPINFFSPIRVNNQTPSEGVQLFVNGSTVLSEPGAQSTATNAGLTIWGLPNGSTIDTAFSTINTTTTTSTIYTINDPVSKINFQLIGSGGANTFSNTIATSEQPPGYGTYISGTLKVKQGDKLQFFIGALGGLSNGSQGTSLVYLSSINSPTNTIFVSTLVCVAGAGGGNGWAPNVASSFSSGGGHGGGGSGGVTVSGNVDYFAYGTIGFVGTSSINGSIVTIVEGGEGGQANGGAGGQVEAPYFGTQGNPGADSTITNLLTIGGLVSGGGGGISGKTGGYGGGGFTGGGGGAGSANTSAGGGGGSTYIAFSTLSAYLSNLVCLGGQWIYQNNATPFGEDYGLPNNPGFASITGYEPNDTLYTNGDIECRVLRYTMLDPPINAIGGASALWSLYPAVDTVHMNDNQILECGGIEVQDGGINVKNFIDIRAGNNDLLATNGFMSQFIRTASSGTYTVDYQVAADSTGFGSNTWQDARYVYNTADAVHNLRQVWGIVTSSNITPVGSTIGDIHFYNSVYVDGKVGIGVTNPSTSLQVVVPPGGDGITGISAKSTDVNTTIGAYSQGWFAGDNVGSIQATREHNSTFYTLALNPRGGDIYLGSSISNLIVFSASTGIGTTSPTTQLQVVGVTSTSVLSASSINSNNIYSNNISTHFISSSNIVNSITQGTSIVVSGTPSGAPNTYVGNITISGVPTPVTTFDNSNIPASFGSYAVINSNLSVVDLTQVVPPGNTAINLINNTSAVTLVSTTTEQQLLYPSTFMNTLYFGSNWLLPCFYTCQPAPLTLYVINLETEIYAAIGYNIASLGKYSKLDYILVGGGGGGGQWSSPPGTANYGGGGGGSGYFKSSFPFVMGAVPTGGGLNLSYSVQFNYVTETTISLAPYSKVQVLLGTGGGTNTNGNPTYLNLYDSSNNLITQISAAGGNAGGAGGSNSAGNGGAGYNGGGGGVGGSWNATGGSGQTSIGGTNGTNASGNDTSGGGGGVGGGLGRCCANLGGESAGGGGGAGPCVSNLVTSLFIGLLPTGGNGAMTEQTSTTDGSNGQNYTGAGGGGGAYQGGTARDGYTGGKGYAILYFHN